MTRETRIEAPPGTPFVEITREFDAPRELVFRAFTDPELLVQWLGPRRYDMRIETYEVRDGGRYRFVNFDGEGNEFWFRGVHHGTPSLDGIVRTFEFEGTPGHVSLESLTFDERDGKTLIREWSTFQSVEDRDAMVEAGMAGGVSEGFARLDEVLARLALARAR
jgi:uncharacterized protein YndB with AHSA1/START domain